MSPNLHTTTAEALVAGNRATVFAAVADLVDVLWPAMTEVVVSEPPRQLMHSVAVDGAELDGWLTWDMTDAGSGLTRVRLVHDEADTSAGPAPELDAVLALLSRSRTVA